jgi:hypothetical protein
VEIETDATTPASHNWRRLCVAFGRARNRLRLLPARAEALLPVIHRFNKLINEIAQALRVLLISYQIAEFSPLLFFLFNRHAMV